ncbi:MAG TPA: hypothetical protein VGM06_06435 [Polyangiaceae bacterium]|jgi:hypothetical protein
MKKKAASRIAFRAMNGLPALVVEIDDPPPRVAPRLVVQCHPSAEGRIAGVHRVLARAELAPVSALGV